VGRIDTHSHVVPPEYADWLRGKGILAGGLPIPSWDIDETLSLMDRYGIAAAVLSVSTPGVHLGDGADARGMARHVNDFAAQAVRDHPTRFGFFATLPLPDVDGALDELDRAFDILGADGVVVLANQAGVYLGDPAFDPVFDELQRRRAVAFVHPSLVPGLDPLDGIPAFIADFLLDTTRAAVSLARSGTLERCPDVRIILAHAGGFVPYAAYRLAFAASSGLDVRHGLSLLQRFYFDIALSSSPSALPSLLAFTSPDHVTFGSDWPYAPEVAIAGMTGMYDSYPMGAAARDQIDRGTAATLFPRLAPVAAT
jgi:predicted TIM-barrel fold metal-dependent hydrolase